MLEYPNEKHFSSRLIYMLFGMVPYTPLKSSIFKSGLACSKRSDSGERCGVKKAMKSRGGLLFFRAPFYFAPLPTI